MCASCRLDRPREKVMVMESATTQCTGATKKGLRCCNMTKDQSGLCHKHSDRKQQPKPTPKSSTPTMCKAMTSKGKPCQNTTKDQSGLCHVHVRRLKPTLTEPGPTGSSGGKSGSVQCQAVTKRGTRCLQLTHSPNGFCRLHRGVQAIPRADIEQQHDEDDDEDGLGLDYKHNTGSNNNDDDDDDGTGSEDSGDDCYQEEGAVVQTKQHRQQQKQKQHQGRNRVPSKVALVVANRLADLLLADDNHDGSPPQDKTAADIIVLLNWKEEEESKNPNKVVVALQAHTGQQYSYHLAPTANMLLLLLHPITWVSHEHVGRSLAPCSSMLTQTIGSPLQLPQGTPAAVFSYAPLYTILRLGNKSKRHVVIANATLPPQGQNKVAQAFFSGFPFLCPLSPLLPDTTHFFLVLDCNNHSNSAPKTIVSHRTPPPPPSPSSFSSPTKPETLKNVLHSHSDSPHDENKDENNDENKDNKHKQGSVGVYVLEKQANKVVSATTSRTVLRVL